MINAISLEQMVENIKDNGKTQRAFAILIGNPNCEFVKNNIISRINEYHHMSNHGIDFYFPGYGAYWYGDIPDQENVCRVDNVDWSFSSEKFCNFIEELERQSKWEYSGETELIILNYKDGKIDYSEVLIFWLDRMVKDGVISSPSNLFQTIFRLFKEGNSVERVSDKMALRKVSTKTIDLVKSKIPLGIGGLIDETSYYCTRNLTRK
jgi:hypothetical protein